MKIAKKKRENQPKIATAVAKIGGGRNKLNQSERTIAPTPIVSFPSNVLVFTVIFFLLFG